LRMIESWHLFEPFISWHASRLRGTPEHVVFTAHSLPARIVDEGDPYRAQLEETAAAIAQRAALGEDRSFSYQSESPTGEPWLGPDILDHLADLRARGIEDVLVCPIGFVSDHLEIRWDIDVEAQERAHELGMTLRRIEMPNAEPEFVRALASLVEQEAGVRASR
jgi:ferrochelatase